MSEHATLAAVDLGSNSFRLEVARVVEHQIYPLDSLKETVRLAAGLTDDKTLEPEAQERALACLRRFGERLRGLSRQSVRVVGTNTLRVATNAPDFLSQAQAALGFPIDIISGREEARLIYLGVSHSLPPSDERRLVVDIGGGSTEFIIGSRYTPLEMESRYMGCVSFSRRFFSDGKITKASLEAAELAARSEIRNITVDMSAPRWDMAIGSSGTAKALAEVLVANGLSDEGITAEGMAQLRVLLLKAKDVAKLTLPGLKPDRIPVLPGGFAVMSAIFSELGIQRMSLSDSALREGLLYDLLGRIEHHDTRDATVRQFMKRYHVDRKQAMRVEELSAALLEQLAEQIPMDLAASLQLLGWAARLHETGLAIAHNGYHKHGAYIIQNADMPGFSRLDQTRLGMLVHAQRHSLGKVAPLVGDHADWAMALSLRLAILFYRNRSDVHLPRFKLHWTGKGFELSLDKAWLEQNLLIETMLAAEAKEWKTVGLGFKVAGE
jgi:exopolyphosphatase/guanosine-5'-triphosphate,3'-diphosphate pyrophosphatase